MCMYILFQEPRSLLSVSKGKPQSEKSVFHSSWQLLIGLQDSNLASLLVREDHMEKRLAAASGLLANTAPFNGVSEYCKCRIVLST